MLSQCSLNDMEKVPNSYLGISCYWIFIEEMKQIVFWCNVGDFVRWGSLHLYFQHCSRDLLEDFFLQLEDTFFWLCYCFVVGSSESSGSYSSPLWSCSFLSSLWLLSMAVASLIWFCEINITTMSSQMSCRQMSLRTLLKNNKPIKICHLEIFIFSSVLKCDCSFSLCRITFMGNAFFPPQGFHLAWGRYRKRIGIWKTETQTQLWNNFSCFTCPSVLAEVSLRFLV